MNICNHLIEIGVVLLLIFTPIYYGSVDLASTVAIELAILAMVLIWGIAMLSQKRFVFRRTPLDIIALLFCLYSIIATLLFSKYAYVSRLNLSLVLCISALYFLIVNNVSSRTRIVRLSVIVVFVGVAYSFLNLSLNSAGLLQSKSITMLNVGNHFAGYIILIIPLSVALSFVVRDIGKAILFIFGGIIMATAMAFSLIAGAMMAFVLSLILIASFFGRSQSTQKKSIILGIIIVCLILMSLWFGYKPVIRELLTVTNLQTGSPSARLSLWKSSFSIFSDYPIVGTGLGTFDYIYPKYRLPDLYGRAVYAHSDWIQLLVELGIIGFLIVSSGTVIFFVSISRRINFNDDGSRWIKGLIVGGLCSAGTGIAHALVEFNLHIPAIAVLFAVIIALTVSASDYIIAKKSYIRLPLKRDLSTWERTAGFIVLFMAIGLSAFIIVRPYIAEVEYQNGIKLERNLLWDDATSKYMLAGKICRGNSLYANAEANIYYKRFNLTKNVGTQKQWAGLAINSYSRAIENCPFVGDYHLRLGSIYEDLGDKNNARLSYLNSIDLDPNNAFYRRIYGNFCLRYGEDEKAIDEYRKSLRVYPGDFRNIIKECYAISSYEKKAFMDIVEEICPSDVKSYELLGRFCMINGWYDDSVRQYNRAIELVPDEFGLWDQLGKFLMHQQKYEEARNLWQRFIEANPSNAQAHGRLADVHVNLGKWHRAIEYYLTASKLDRSNSNYPVSASDLYVRQGNFDEALNLLEEAKKQSPNLAGVNYRLGIFYEKRDEWSLAVDSFQRAIALDPSNMSYRLYLAKRYYRQEQIYEAIGELEQASRISPKNISVRMELAKIYRELGEFDKARGYYRQILDIEPNNVGAIKALLSIVPKTEGIAR